MLRPLAPLLSLLLAAMAAGCAEPPALVLEPAGVDFGVAEPGTVLTRAIDLVNPGLDPVNYTLEVRPSGVFGVSPAAGTLDAATRITVDLSALPPGTGLYDSTLHLVWSGGDVAAVLRVEGRAGAVDGDRDGSVLGEDCDDTDPAVSPLLDEACDGIDNDCDGAIDEGFDSDGDGWASCFDCDDADSDVYPDAWERCDGIDNDCDEVVDEVFDDDLDGFDTCTDCDDTDPEVHPEAVEVCDGVDNDCNEQVDEGFDGDGDGSASCFDCDDANAAVFPGADEVCDGLDTDCEGSTGFGEVDDDADGVLACGDYVEHGGGFAGGGDCDDGNAAVLPGAPEACDGLDTDCDGVVPVDELDADGDGWLECDGYVDHGGGFSGGGDCDDSALALNPGAAEVCDGLDTDCDGTLPADEQDADGDGWLECSGYVDNGGGFSGGEDCEDGAAGANPGAAEACDGLDTDCDGTVPADELDGDGDGWLECSGYVDNGGGFSGGGDCDDGAAAVHPGAAEGCDGVDTNCDGVVDPTETDDDGDGQAECEGDCNDGQAGIYDGAVEACDGVDNDCDLSVDEDFDGDGDGWTNGLVAACVSFFGAAGVDCDDGDAAVNPGAAEACDGVDTDCDGATLPGEVDGDGDGWFVCDNDCDDGNGAINPGASEVLCDGVDNDCNGTVDDGAVDQEFFVRGVNGGAAQLWESDGAGAFTGPTPYAPASGGTVRAAIAADFSGDGFLDFVVQRDPSQWWISQRAHLFTSNCQGGFAETALDGAGLTMPDGVYLWAAGDIDNDGDPDLIGWDYADGDGWTWTNANGSGTSWSRTPTNSWQTRPFELAYWSPGSTGGRESVSLPMLDVNGDGNLDFVECQASESNPQTSCRPQLGTGNGTFTWGPQFTVARMANGVAFGDFDNDGQVEMLGGLDDDGDAGQVWYWDLSVGATGLGFSGAGSPAFDVTPDSAGNDSDQPGYGWMAAYDWNADGFLDVLVSVHDPAWSDDREMYVALGDGTGDFTVASIGSSAGQWSDEIVQDALGVPVW